MQLVAQRSIPSDPDLEAKLSVARNRGQFQGSRSNSATCGRLGNEMRSVSKNLSCHVRETHEQDVVDSLYNLDFREGLLHGICLPALRTTPVLSAAFFHFLLVVTPVEQLRKPVSVTSSLQRIEHCFHHAFLQLFKLMLVVSHPQSCSFDEHRTSSHTAVILAQACG